MNFFNKTIKMRDILYFFLSILCITLFTEIYNVWFEFDRSIALSALTVILIFTIKMLINKYIKKSIIYTSELISEIIGLFISTILLSL